MGRWKLEEMSGREELAGERVMVLQQETTPRPETTGSRSPSHSACTSPSPALPLHLSYNPSPSIASSLILPQCAQPQSLMNIVVSAAWSSTTTPGLGRMDDVNV